MKPIYLTCRRKIDYGRRQKSCNRFRWWVGRGVYMGVYLRQKRAPRCLLYPVCGSVVVGTITSGAKKGGRALRNTGLGAKPQNMVIYL